MTGRNSRPPNDGPAASPSRMEQFGEKEAQEAKQDMKMKYPKNTCK